MCPSLRKKSYTKYISYSIKHAIHSSPVFLTLGNFTVDHSPDTVTDGFPFVKVELLRKLIRVRAPLEQMVSNFPDSDTRPPYISNVPS